MASSSAYFFSPEGELFVEGEDAAVFLQGQFSNNLRIADGAVAYGLWLSSKGKVLADSFVLKQSEESFLAISYFCETTILQENLESRIIMDEVETRPPATEFRGASLWGDAIGLAREALNLEEVEEGAFAFKDGVYAFWGRRGSEPNLEIVSSNAAAMDGLLEAIEGAEIRILDTFEIELMALRSGNYEVSKDILPSDLPQEVGLGDIAVSYNKGCYIGQEVMARLKAMGQSRRSLEWVSVSRDPSGVGPWVLRDGAGKRAGELRRTILGEGAERVGSAMLKKANLDDTFTVESQPEIRVSRIVKD